jgi:hypothetical protein
MYTIYCDYCSQSFKTVNSWIRHTEMEIKTKHKKNGNLTCKSCQFKAKSLTALMKHAKRRVCKTGIIAQDKCDNCKKLFCHKSNLRDHLKTKVCIPRNRIDYWIDAYLTANPVQLFSPKLAKELDDQFKLIEHTLH